MSSRKQQKKFSRREDRSSANVSEHAEGFGECSHGSRMVRHIPEAHRKENRDVYLKDTRGPDKNTPWKRKGSRDDQHFSNSSQGGSGSSFAGEHRHRRKSRKDNAKKYNNQRYHQPSCAAKNFSKRRCRTPEAANCTDGQKPEDDVLEIPGFHYDKEKKKYFKILPNHSNVSGKITKDIIKSTKVEKQRQKDLEEFSQSNNSWKSRNCTIKGTICSQRLKSTNVFHTLTNSSIGARPVGVTQSLIDRYLVKRLVPRVREKVVQEDSGHGIDKIQDIKLMILSKDSKTLMGVWSLNGILGQRMNQVHIKPVKKVSCDGHVEMSMTRSFSVNTLSHSKVTSVCWAPRSNEQDGSRLLLTMTSYIGDRSNFIRLWDYNSSQQENYFDVGRKLLWSSAWSSSSNSFSVGTESCSLIIDVNTRSMWELYSNKCPVYAQKFSQTQQQLYTGNRRGQVFIHDLRSRSTLPVSIMAHRLSIADLYHSCDGHNIVASDVSGNIKKWDLRKMSVVHEYPGHVNEYLKNPFHVDDQEKILCTVGEDCYTRMWCYRTGELLHTIPSPHPVSVSQIPAVAYSNNMGGPGGLPGLLMAVKGEFHFYTY